MLRSSLFLLLPACLINTELYEQRLDELTDDDKDGFREDDGDCNDTDPNVYPRAPERCDEQDNNCNGRIDEKPVDSTFYADTDGDGAGTDASAIATCTAPDGFVATPGDCNDQDDRIHPAALERCNGQDDDCDGDTDESSATDARTWYLDGDGDGHAGTEGAVVQCSPPDSRYLAEATDCDDTDPDSYPDAPERCDTLDNDCDELIDEPPTTGGGSWYRDVDEDGFGDPSDTVCTAQEGYVEAGGDCADADPQVHPAVDEVCNDGLDNNCNGDPDGCAWPASDYMPGHIRITGAHESAGLGSAAAVGDLDGDGVLELILGVPGAVDPVSGDQSGAALAFETPITASLDSDDASISTWGGEPLHNFGQDIAIQDLDGDGYHDLMVGIPGSHPVADGFAGSVAVFLGPLSSTRTLADEADWTAYDTGEWDELGWVLEAVGDPSGDGRPDFVAGSFGKTVGSEEFAGGIYLFDSLGTGSSTASSAAAAFLHGSETEESFGVSSAGLDANGDGIDDLLIGAIAANEVHGAAFVFFGPVNGDLASTDADVNLAGEGYNGFAGNSVDDAGDINGDGTADLLIGAHQQGDGSVYLVHGGASLSSRSLSDAELKIRGDRHLDRIGYIVRGIGDLNEDGELDILAGEGARPPSDVNLFFGPFGTGVLSASTADVILEGDGRTDTEYSTALGPVDLTGDGTPDLLVSNRLHSLGSSTYEGIAYLIPGISW